MFFNLASPSPMLMICRQKLHVFWDKIRVWQAPQLRLNYKRTSQRQTINEYKIDEMTNQRHKDNSTDQQQEQANSENCGPLPGNNFDLKVCQRSRSRHCVNWKGLSQGSTCQISMLIINTWEDMRQDKSFFDRQRDRRTYEWVLMSLTFAKGGNNREEMSTLQRSVT